MKDAEKKRLWGTIIHVAPMREGKLGLQYAALVLTIHILWKELILSHERGIICSINKNLTGKYYENIYIMRQYAI